MQLRPIDPVAKRRRMMLFTNNGGSGLRQALLDGAPFLAELTHSLVPQRGSITPAFTRATTETGQRWDEAGYLDFTALAGEAVFTGAMRVYNQLSNGGAYKSSGLFNNWTKSGTPVVTDGIEGPTGTLSAGRLVMDAGEAIYTVGANGTGRTGQIAAWLRADAPGTIRLLASNSGTFTDCSLTTEWEQFSVPAFAMSNLDGVAVQRNGAGQLATVYVDLTQIVDITGETDQTTIRPYVSVGVESAPAYHGSMVDGVKCYDTDRSGNPISTSGSYPLVGYVPWEARTNLCLQSNAFTTTWTNAGTPSATQNVVGPDGGTTGWTLTDNNAASIEGVSQTIALTAATYTYSVFVNKTTGAQSSYPAITTDNGVSRVAACTVDTTNGVATVWTAYTGLTVQTSSATCVSHNENYWRVSLTFLATAENWTHYLIVAATTNATQSTGVLDATAQGSAVFYGAQVELGSFATPYQPTTTVAVARNADLLTYTGADVANIKTLAATFSRGVGVNSNGYAVALSDGTTNNYISMSTPSATQARFLGVTGGVTQWDTIPAYTAGVTSKVSQSFATNDIKMDKDGVGQTPDTVATLPTVTQLNIGHIAGGFVLNGPVNHIYGWTRNLSQSELGAVDR